MIREWLDIRPGETRSLTLSFLGAFLVMSFLVLSRSFREALYLTNFAVETLPYITVVAAVLSIPTVGLFSKFLTRYHPGIVLRTVIVIAVAGLAVLWPFTMHHAWAVILFYLWTVLTTLLLTSGFWIITNELFAVREAKRLFGLIGAGGTAGTMISGISVGWLSRWLGVFQLIPGLLIILALFFLIQMWLPRREVKKPGFKETPASKEKPESKELIDDFSAWKSFQLIWKTPYLRTIALVVFIATIASTLLDFQFKEMARANLESTEQLAGFFGAFYGWTGGVALILQLAVVARIISSAGIALSLAVLPIFLLFGSAGFVIIPGLLLITLLRGADNSLRKAIHRPVLEFLYMPISPMLRRKTKTFIDSVVDSLAEGAGAALIFLWVTLPGLPSRYLSLFVIVFACLFLFLCRRVNRQYLKAVTDQLKVQEAEAEDAIAKMQVDRRGLLSVSFTRIDLQAVLRDMGLEAKDFKKNVSPQAPPVASIQNKSMIDRLKSANEDEVKSALSETQSWDESHFPALTRLLARDTHIDHVIQILCGMGESPLSHMVDLLRSDNTDFVIRRRLPKILAKMGGGMSDDALLDALSVNRFEVRYRAAIALVKRRRTGMPISKRDYHRLIWDSIKVEVNRDRPIWELSKLLDGPDTEEDDFVSVTVGTRGELSLEHTFRLMTLVLDPEPVRAAYHGIILNDDRLKGFALEYLEQVLPVDIKQKLWPFIGDISEHRRKKSIRSVDRVVSDLMATNATLFATGLAREELLKKFRTDREDFS